MGRLVLLLGVVLAAAACGGASTETVTVTGTPQTETHTVTVTLEPEPTVSTSAPALKTPTFQMPSKNIGCATSEGVLVCDILSGLKPEPKQKCELDWTGMEMERLGPSQPRCAGDTAYVQSAPVLQYGSYLEPRRLHVRLPAKRPAVPQPGEPRLPARAQRLDAVLAR